MIDFLISACSFGAVLCLDHLEDDALFEGQADHIPNVKAVPSLINLSFPLFQLLLSTVTITLCLYVATSF